jgi:hypothetical protein
MLGFRRLGLNIRNNTNIVKPICIQSRSLIFVHEKDDPSFWTELSEYAEDSELCGADPYPLMRKEHVKGKTWRFMKANRTKGRISTGKVKALVDIINYKRERKYQ